MEALDVFADVRLMPFETALTQGKITLMGAETDDRFLANVMAQANDPQTVARVADTFKMVFTPFHGTGYRLIPEVLHRLGMKHVLCVPEQMTPDGDFPTVTSPNRKIQRASRWPFPLPAKRRRFYLGSDQTPTVWVFWCATDGEYVAISGNQTGVLLLDYLIAPNGARAPCPKSHRPENHRHHRAGAQGCRGQRRSLPGHFYRFKFMAEKKNELEHGGEARSLSYESLTATCWETTCG
jgi:phosphoglucomutase